jgi:hypothetical protein
MKNKFAVRTVVELTLVIVAVGVLIWMTTSVSDPKERKACIERFIDELASKGELGGPGGPAGPHHMITKARKACP